MFDKCSICKEEATRLVATLYNLNGDTFEFEPRCNKHNWKWEEEQNE